MTLRAGRLVVVIAGLITFFLPLVRMQAPIVGTQRISGWDAIKPSDEKARRDDLGLLDALERFQRNVLRKKLSESPVAVQQAQSLGVTLPLAYVSLLLGGVFVLLRKSRALQITAGIGLLACVWSLFSVFWLSSGVKEMLAGAVGSRTSLLGRLTQPLAEKTSVSPELGLYVLACSLAVLLVISLVPAKK